MGLPGLYGRDASCSLRFPPSELVGVLETARSRSYGSVIPILPSPADVLTAYESAGIAKAASIPFAFVLNSVPAGGPDDRRRSAR